jgi:hypothetical protein
LVPSTILNKKIFSPNDIDEMISDIPQVEYKGLIYFSYCGLNINEIRYLRMQDYNSETNELKLKSGKIYRPDKLFYNLMWQIDSLEYYDIDGTGSCAEGWNKFKYMYVPTEYVFKIAGKNNTIDDAITIQVYYGKLIRIQKYFNNKNITNSNLRKSGLYNYIKEKYAEKGITIQEAFKKKKNERDYEYESKTQEYIYEFGEKKMTVRMLRMGIMDIIDQL